MRAIWFTSALLLVGLAVGPAAAQGGGPHGPMHQGATHQGRMYDPETVTVISGTVDEVERVPSPRGGGEGVHLRVRADEGPVRVDLGPGWYVDQRQPKIARGDRVRVTGSRVVVGGEPVVIAREVQKGEDVLRLRSESGVPEWSRGPRTGGARR